MLNLIYSDLFKLFKSTAVKVSFFITSMCAVSLIIVSRLSANGTLEEKVTVNTIFLSDVFVMSIIGAVIAGIFICSDFENKTVNAAISCGYGRGTILVSKSIVYFLVMAIMLLPYSIGTIIAFVSGIKFGTLVIPSVFMDIFSNKAGLEISVNVIFKMLAIILTLTIVYASRLSICVLLAFILRRPVFVVGTGFGLAFVFDFIVVVKDKLGVFGKLLEYNPFAQNYPVLTMASGAGTILKAIVCSIVFIIIILSITYIIFRRTEIK
ncbi:ABC-2 type transport system permease protein [Clostridium cavendishii DSM 21758]|uniref:ABC-2 type transport system permease protein n=1 Tax=Clostridium cavendishii DSM 21758 TaxID=1121302 RepID=A0A1M6CAR4_9CLOT|nr:hypothetical protein [Clostridium cavendishii]SHI58086.1 ABC-2 type transport system permease protein [Clostridium cavendishii DSM 21758]